MRFRIGIILSLLLLTACGGGGGSNNNNNDNGGTKPTVSVKISPQPSADVVIGESTIFTVTTQNTGFDLTVVPSSGHGCSKSGNSVTCAPTAAGNYTLTVTASADTSKKETATLLVSAPEPEPEPAVTIVEPADGKLSLWADQTEATISFEADGPWTITVTDVSAAQSAAVQSAEAGTSDFKTVKTADSISKIAVACTPVLGNPAWVYVPMYDNIAGVYSLALRLEPNYGQCDRTAEIDVTSGKDHIIFTIIQRGIMLDKKYDVYTGGSFQYYRRSGGMEGGRYANFYIKNGETVWPPLIDDRDWLGLDMAVSGNDVYFAGYLIASENGNKVIRAISWKNGEATTLPVTQPNSWATGIAVVGNDVYVSGVEAIIVPNTSPVSVKYVAKYWKNNVAYTLGNGVESSETFGIRVVGSDVYVLGRKIVDVYGGERGYWKNGQWVGLKYLGKDPDWIYDLCVSGQDVYVLGDVTIPPYTNADTNAVYWKNQEAHSIGDKFYGMGGSIAVSGDDVYIVRSAPYPDATSDGYLYNTYPSYWKNGEWTTLTTAYKGSAVAITIVDKDVYISVALRSASTSHRFYKNGVEIGVGWEGNDNRLIVVPHNPSRKW